MMRTILLLIAVLWSCHTFAMGSMLPDIVNAIPVPGGGGGGCTAATNYLARTTGGNEGGNSANITTLICGLVTDGVITSDLSGARGCGTQLDAFYLLAQQNDADNHLNICGTSYTATNGNTPTFVGAYQCYTWGSNAFFSTNFNPSTATSPNFTQNAASYGFWTVSVTTEAVAQMGNGTGGAGASQIFDNFSGADFYGRINSAAGTATNVATGTKGEFVAERTSSSNTTLYLNGSSQGNVTDTSQAPLSSGFTIGSVGILSNSNQTLCEAHIGVNMGGTLELALYNRLRTYMTAVGIP